MVTKYAIHPFAKIFPLIDSLVEEIAAELRKTRKPPTIILYEGKVLDGQHRYLACVKAGIEPIVRHYTGKDARAFVIRTNITRRHLSTEERANLAAELATCPTGRPENRPNDRFSDEAIKPSNDGLIQDRPMSTQEAAKLMKVSERSVRRAKARKAGKSPKPAKPKGSNASDVEPKLVNLVMHHLDQIEPQAFLDGLGKLIPTLKERIAQRQATARTVSSKPRVSRNHI